MTTDRTNEYVGRDMKGVLVVKYYHSLQMYGSSETRAQTWVQYIGHIQKISVKYVYKGKKMCL